MLYKPFHELATLIVVVNPIGVVPLFIDIAAARQRIGERAVIIAAVILLAFIAIKQILPDPLGVDLASFRIADGLMLVVIGLRMVLEEPRSADTHNSVHKISPFFRWRCHSSLDRGRSWLWYCSPTTTSTPSGNKSRRQPFCSSCWR